MPKLIPLLLHIESIAFGEALLKINAMPGVAKYEIPLGHGGEGAGRKELEHAVARRSPLNLERTVFELLVQGPKSARDIAHAMDKPRVRASNALTILAKKGLVERAGGGLWQLTNSARAHMDQPARTALPAPAKARKTATGRAAQGSGPILLRTALAAGAKPARELREHLAAQGMSAKSLTGVLERAKRDGIIRKNGAGYELTAKGNKLNAEAAHG